MKNSTTKKKLRRVGKFRIFPTSEIDWKRPPRKAVVDWGRGNVVVYRFEHLPHSEVDAFWRMNDKEKVIFLVTKFNVYHRLPRCQRGKTVPENLSYVDIASHDLYNGLIVVVMKWAGLATENKVKTLHIARFLCEVYPKLLRTFMIQDTCKMSRISDALKRGNSDMKRNLVPHVAKWAGLRYKAVKPVDINYFLEYLHPIIKRLAVDHVTGRVLHLQEFVKILNDIWLPVNDQIRLSIHH